MKYYRNWIILERRYTSKSGNLISVLKFSWASHPVRTKNVLKTLNKTGELFYFRPEHLLEREIINKLEMVELIGYRKQYGRIKACLLELK